MLQAREDPGWQQYNLQSVVSDPNFDLEETEE